MVNNLQKQMLPWISMGFYVKIISIPKSVIRLSVSIFMAYHFNNTNCYFNKKCYWNGLIRVIAAWPGHPKQTKTCRHCFGKLHTGQKCNETKINPSTTNKTHRDTEQQQQKKTIVKTHRTNTQHWHRPKQRKRNSTSNNKRTKHRWFTGFMF